MQVNIQFLVLLLDITVFIGALALIVVAIGGRASKK